MLGGLCCAMLACSTCNCASDLYIAQHLSSRFAGKSRGEASTLCHTTSAGGATCKVSLAQLGQRAPAAAAAVTRLAGSGCG